MKFFMTQAEEYELNFRCVARLYSISLSGICLNHDFNLIILIILIKNLTRIKSGSPDK
jgi:hypothetical protein